MKNYIKTIFLLCLLLFSTKVAQADSMDLNLYYDPENNLLKVDEYKENPISLNQSTTITNQEFYDKALYSTGAYILNFHDNNDKIFQSIQFNPIHGAFTINFPFYKLLSRISITDKATGMNLLSVDNSGSTSVCNINGVCEFELNESLQTCINDCGSGKVVYSEKTLEILKRNNGLLRDEKSNQVLIDARDYLNERKTEGEAEKNKSENGNQSSPFIGIISFIIGLILLAVIGAAVYKIRK